MSAAIFRTEGTIVQNSFVLAKSSLLKAVSKSPPALVSLIGLAILANAFAAYYVAQEHTIYFWDHSGYWVQYIDLSKLLAQHPISALRQVISSVRYSDYGLLPVVPLVPFEWIFGPSRQAYILAVTNIYMLPGAFLIALLAQRMTSAGPSAFSLVSATTIILALHSLWVPVLQGWPEAAGLLVIGVILLLHFAEPFSEQRWTNLITTGLLLCLLMLLRRWYAYWVAAFFPALAVAQGLNIYQRYGLALQHYIIPVRNAVVIGLTFLLALFGCAWPFAWRAITTDYSDIYSAFRTSNSLLETAVSLSFYFGWLIFFGGLIGLLTLVRRRQTRLIATFLLVQSFVAFVLFARTQDFIHHHYLLFPAIASGFVAITIDIARQITGGFRRAAALGILLAILLAGSSAVFFSRAEPVSKILGVLAPQFHWYPAVRNDFDALDRLLDRLEELERRRPGDVYVLASSTVLNESILQNYCRLGPRPRAFCDRFLISNHVDKRDGFPRQLLNASYLIFASPTQYHLRPDDQRVIGLLAREVEARHGIGGSFERLSGEFRLDGNVTTSVYEKTRPFEKSDLEALSAEFIKYYPDRRAIFGAPSE